MMKTEIMKSTDVDLARASPIMKGSTGTIQQTYVALGEMIFTDHPETYNLLGMVIALLCIYSILKITDI